MNENTVCFSWQDVQEAALACLKRLPLFEPVEAVIALGRGGAIPAAYLAYQLDIPLEYIHYSRQNGLQGTTIDRFKQGARFLLVDDATETGGTFETIKKVLPNYEFVTCALFHSEKASYQPDIYGSFYEAVNPLMPWEKEA